MKNYNNFILEKNVNKEPLSSVYNKYYKNIDKNDFNKIVSADPTSLIDDKLYMGKYSKWLVNLFKNKKLKLEDLYKATEYLHLFDKQSVRNKLERKNINDYDSLPDLAKEILPFKDSNEIKSKSEIKDDNFIISFINYDLYIPRTFKDSCILGKGTEWCTATENTSSYYKQYHKPGRELLIFISKLNPKIKFQLHLRSKQFMDIYDNQQDLTDWLSENKDINDWLLINYEKEFKKYFNQNNVRWTENTLQGSPEIVEGDFSCSNNNLTSLQGGPKIVEGYFYCYSNNLTSLEGAPEIVEGEFNCGYNNLSSLQGAPEKIEGDFVCSNNKLTSLDGCPKIVEGDFYCSNNKLISLDGCPKIVEGDFYCSNNKLTENDIEWLKQNCDIKGKIFWK